MSDPAEARLPTGLDPVPLAEAVPHLVWTARPDGVVDYYNAQAARYDGLVWQGSEGWNWEPALHPEDAERTVVAWEHALASGEAFEAEHRLRMTDGSFRWHVSRARPARDEGGRVVRWYGTATDVHRLKETEGRYQSLFDSIDEGFCIIEMLFGEDGAPVDYRFLEVNPAFEGQTGLSDPVGRTARELVPELEDHWFETYGRVAVTGEPVRFVNGAEDLEGRWFDVYAFRLGGSASRRVAILFKDITAQVRAREALAEVNAELERRVEERTQQVRQLSRALALAEQDERQRLAYVLHDDLQQVLFGAQVAAAVGDSERLRAVLDEAMDLTRTLSHELSPPLLQGEDIEELLEWVADRKRARYGLEVEVEVRSGVRVPDPALRVLLYGLLRELLFNVAKHADTSRARVVAERADGHVRITVTDEGSGFDAAAVDKAGTAGVGLMSVRERLDLVGGRLHMTSAPGRGTRVTIELPIEQATGPAR